jgi:membrane protein DedA with SNARE-associated domain
MLTLLSLMFGTLLSEDAACIAAGVLIQRGEVGALAGTAACALGIFGGDVALWAAGRFSGHAIYALPFFGTHLNPQRHHEMSAWLLRHAGRSIVTSRFLPGSRLPLYVAAGVLNLPLRVFAGWALVATLVWTPSLVLLTAQAGRLGVQISPWLGVTWPGQLAAAATMLFILRMSRDRRTPRNRLLDCIN